MRLRVALLIAGVYLTVVIPNTFAQPGDPRAAQTLWLEGAGLKLKTSIYKSSILSGHPVLIVVLHGDLLGFRAVPSSTYHYIFADEVTKRINDVVVAAILRPGYRDSTGERSRGELGQATGDNYTRDRVDAVAGVIKELKTKFRPSKIVVVGHSGGAATTANLLALHPSLVNAALLVSCNCDVAAWRKYMLQVEPKNPAWTSPINFLSPLDLVAAVSPSVQIAILQGAKDTVAPPSIIARYVEALKKHVKNVTFTIAPDSGHEMLSDPVTYNALKMLVQSLRLTSF